MAHGPRHWHVGQIDYNLVQSSRLSPILLLHFYRKHPELQQRPLYQWREQSRVGPINVERCDAHQLEASIEALATKLFSG